MKRFCAILLAAMVVLAVSTACAATDCDVVKLDSGYSIVPHSASACFAHVGEDIEPGNYGFIFNGGITPLTVNVVSFDEGVKTGFLTFKEEYTKAFTQPVLLELLEGNGLTVKGHPLVIFPLTPEEVYEIKLSDPNYCTIRGVDLRKAFREAARQCEANEYIKHISFTYGSSVVKGMPDFFSATLYLKRRLVGAQDGERLCKWAASVLNDAFSAQNSEIMLSTESSAGEIYDDFTFSVYIDVPNTSSFAYFRLDNEE